MEKTQGLEECLKYIDSYWKKIIYHRKESRRNPHIIPLPNSFIATNTRKTSQWHGVMFYWDSFFILRGLIGTKREWIIPKMIDNFVYLFKNFGIIPNASMYGFLDHSQPPFFSSMIFDGYYAIKHIKGLRGIIHKPYAKAWLKKRMRIAKEEYWNVWEDTKIYTHKVVSYGLNRYGDRDVGYGLTSERESGWDFTTRFYNRCDDFLPVDLNAYLHKYEKDFAKTAHILGDEIEEGFWEHRALERHNTMKKYMWNETKGFFFDYDHKHDLQSEFYSLAGFVPMWGELATYEEAKRMRKKLALFETEYGLTITAKISLPPLLKFDHVPPAYRHSIISLLTPKQWDYPHIWSPLEYLTVIGLIRYGFIDDAVRIMKKSVKANIRIFKKYGSLLEKMDANTGEMPKTFWYPTQLGFGWTNAIVYRYVHLLDLIKKNHNHIFEPGSHEKFTPPYDLTHILH